MPTNSRFLNCMNVWRFSKKRRFGLLVRYLTGQSSAREREEVLARLAVDDELSRSAEEVERILAASRRPSMGPVDPPFDEADFINRLNRRIDRAEERQDEVSAPRVRGGRPEESDLGRAAQVHTLPSSQGMTVVKGPRRPASSMRRKTIPGVLARVALVVGLPALVVAIVLVLWPSVLPSSGTPSETASVYATDVGQRATIRLADGTVVQLNVRSRLTVQAGFPETGREVRLNGQAYFEIAADSSRPFRIRAGQAAIEVVGTQFDVRAYDDEGSIQVVVAEGAVSMQGTRASPPETVVLGPRQLGLFEGPTPTVVRRDVAVEAYLAWTEGVLVFQAAPFVEVARQLERWYDLEVDLTVPSDSVGRLSASFGRDESLGIILNVVADALSLQVERAGRRVTFRPIVVR